MYYRLNPLSVSFEDFNINYNDISSNELKDVEELYIIKVEITVNLGLSLLKLGNYNVYSILHENEVFVEWNIIKYLPLEQYILLIDHFKLGLDFDNTSNVLEITDLFKHCAVFPRQTHMFTVDLINHRHLNINKVNQNGIEIYTPFCKDILFSGIVYLNNEFIETTDLDEKEKSRMYVYATKVLDEEEIKE